MLYLVLVVLLNVLLAIGFKLFSRWQIDTFQAIVINYWVCVVTGSVFMGHFPVGIQSLEASWFPFALITGLGFISVFNFFAFCTTKMSITTATVANKLSLAIPVVFSVYLYGEHITVLHAIAILLAFPAVYLVSLSSSAPIKNVTPAASWAPRLMLVLLFFGSGLLDTLMKYVETNFLLSAPLQAAYTVHVFFVAACIGTLITLIMVLRGKMSFRLKHLLGGIAIGVPNFFSIYFFIRMLESDFIQSSALIPLANIGVLFVSTLSSILFFREQLNPAKRWGLVLACMVIVLLYLA